MDGGGGLTSFRYRLTIHPRNATGIDRRREEIATTTRVDDREARTTIILGKLFLHAVDFYGNVRVCARSGQQVVQEMHL